MSLQKREFNFTPKLIVYDFDGVMTDNRAYVDETGKECVAVHRGDGYAIRMIKDNLNIPQIIISSEANPIVLGRAEKLKIPVIHNVGDSKKKILEEYCKRNTFKLSETLYIGNDLNDKDAMLLCGYKCCPADAEPEITNICDYVINIAGGYGVIRELYRLLLNMYSDNNNIDLLQERCPDVTRIIN